MSPFAPAEDEKSSKEVIFKGKKRTKGKKSQDPVAIMLPQRNESDSEGELHGEDFGGSSVNSLKKNVSQ